MPAKPRQHNTALSYLFAAAMNTGIVRVFTGTFTITSSEASAFTPSK
jgi:hypothetical protein